MDYFEQSAKGMWEWRLPLAFQGRAFCLFQHSEVTAEETRSESKCGPFLGFRSLCQRYMQTSVLVPYLVYRFHAPREQLLFHQHRPSWQVFQGTF